MPPLGPNTTIESFGYLAPSDVSIAELLAATRNFSTMAAASTPSDLAEIAAAGLSATLSAAPVVFQPNSSELYSDWQARFDAWWATFAPNQGIVTGISVCEEAFAVNANPPPGWVTVPPSQLRDSINAVCDYIHAQAPGAQASGYFGYPETFFPEFWTTMFPTHLDVISSNCYRDDTNYTVALLTFIVQQLVANKQPAQKIILVADAWNSAPPVDPAATDALRVAKLRLIKRLVLTSPDIIGIAVFMWTPPGDARGSGVLPQLETEIAEYYFALKGAASCQQQEGADLVTRDLDGRELARTPNAFPSPPPTASIFATGPTPSPAGQPMSVVFTSEYADGGYFQVNGGPQIPFGLLNFNQVLTPEASLTFAIHLTGPGGVVDFDWTLEVA